jgi:hypothetical protein
MAALTHVIASGLHYRLVCKARNPSGPPNHEIPNKTSVRPHYVSTALQLLKERPFEMKTTGQVESILLVMNKRAISPESKMTGYGGGISSINDVVVGVDAAGNFFYLAGDKIVPLDISANQNRDAAIAYMEAKSEKNAWRTAKYFRILDLEMRDSGGATELFLTHNYWDAEREAKFTRLSRLNLPDYGQLPEANFSYGIEDWDVIFECHQALEFDDVKGSPYLSNHSGGRIAFGPDNALYVSFGDQLLDGVNRAFVSPQAEDSCFGKILRIDPRTRGVEEYARGVRNPQGLAFDSTGRLWESEHGPRGGDELNLIRRGDNYGLPYNTFGTSIDGKRFWPMSIEQGRHEQYTPPVYSWLPSIGPSALLQVGAIPVEWSGDLLLGSLKNGSLHRLRIVDERVVLEERIVIGERIRDMVQLSDGTLVLWTDAPRIIELTFAPATQGLQLVLR